MRTLLALPLVLLLGCIPQNTPVDKPVDIGGDVTKPIKTAQCAPHTLPIDYAEARKLLSLNARTCAAVETTAYRITEAMCDEVEGIGLPSIELRIQYTVAQRTTTEVFAYINNNLALAYARIDDALCTGRLGAPFACLRYASGSTRMWCINTL